MAKIELIPKFLNIQCSLTVVHDHLLGWDRTTGEWMNGSEDMKCFPYGIDIDENEDIKKSMDNSNALDRGAVAADYHNSAFGGPYGQMPATSRSSWFHGDTPSTSLYRHGNATEQAVAQSNEYSVSIVHIPSQMTLYFKALLTSLSDSFALKWDSQTLYGRMDPARSFQGTQRTCSISWDVVSHDIEEAIINLRKVTNFVKMLYPLQTTHGSATSIKAPPMVAIKFTNLVSQGPIGGNRGLTGTLTGFTFAPNIDAGFFEYERVG